MIHVEMIDKLKQANVLSTYQMFQNIWFNTIELIIMWRVFSLMLNFVRILLFK